MKKSNISGKKVRFPSPFYTIDHKTERSGVAVLMHWMRNIIEGRGIDIGLPDVETAGGDRKMPDTVIYESRRSKNILCVIEAKPPYFYVFNEEELKEPARKKATARKAKYFALTNFKTLIWYNTEKVNAALPEEEQIIDKYSLSEIESLDNLEESRFREPIKRGLEQFLIKLYSVYTGKEEEPKQAIDEFLVFRLHQEIKIFSIYYRSIIEERCHKDNAFASQLSKWFTNQGWSFARQSQDFDRAARQTAYLLVNKILFYNLLQAKRPDKLAKLDIPEGLLKGGQLQKILQSFFDEVLQNIDYETIFTTDFIDNVAFPDVKEVIKEIKRLVNILKKYNFLEIGYDVIGRIFEQLIPQEERHNLGQYFTHSDVVDLILKFCLHHEDDKIFDPACGSGTFLVRAYKHKKIMNDMKPHGEILDTLWGNDIAKFPVTLAIINLVINDLSIDKNYPNIMQEDFFDLLVGEKGFDPIEWRKKRARTLNMEEREIVHPRWFEAIVGNPPYVRQEEGKEKEKWYRALIDLRGNKIANITKRAGIHTYFFIHGTKFLREEGYFGFIVSNSWLDVDYGKGLQQFFLKNYKIIAIIESKVERWFEEADINTCIVILQKCRNRKERDENLARFVYLKKPLKHFIPSAKKMWEQEVKRLSAIDRVKKTILAHNEFYENEDLRVFPKIQKELWKEGFDSEENKYVGAKWSKYLRAPKIFFRILEKAKGKLVPLKEVADVRFGIKTGANEFFYLTEDEIKQKGIEKEFWMHKGGKKWVPNYVIKSPRECKSIVVNPEDLRYRVLMIHKNKKDLKGTRVLKYINKGERKGFHKRPTCASRRRWYDLGIWERPDLIWSDAYNNRYGVYDTQKTWADKRFFYITFKKNANSVLLQSYLNSSIIPLLIEIDGITNLGEGVIYTNVYQLEKFGIPWIKKSGLRRKLLPILNKLKGTKILSVFHELGASSPEEVSLDKVRKNRRELDKIIMGEILGLTDEEQFKVYRAVVDLVKSRIEKAKSFGKRKKTKGGIDIDALVKIIMDKIGDETLGKFYKEKILSQKQLYAKKLPRPSDKILVEQDLYGWRLYSGKKHIACESEHEANYLKVWLEMELEKVKIPKDEEYLETILPELENLKKQIDEIVNSYLESILDSKTRAKIEHQLWMEILK